MYKTFFFLSAAILMALCSCRKPEIGRTSDCNCPSWDSSALHPKKAQFQAVLNKYTAKGLPGIAVLVRDQHGLWTGASGMADIGNGVAMKPCHVSKIASLTKMFNGVLILMMKEAGQVNLDDPVSKWLSAEEIKDIANADVATLRQCLNHTSGIYDVVSDAGFYLEVLNNPEKFWSPEEVLKFVRKKPAYFEPGQGAHYSNTNTLVAVLVLEKITGRKHNELMHEKILAPLGMNDTYYHWHDDLPAFTAQGYFDLYNNGKILNLTSYNTGSGNGYGGMYSTVYDLRVFVEKLFRDKTLLSDSSLQEMQVIHFEEDEAERGLGVSLMKDFLTRYPDEYALGHRGRDLAYSADGFYFPQKDITMTFVVNYGTNGKSSLQQVFFDFRKELVDVIMQ